MAVKLAYEWYATEAYSDGQVARKLNAYRHKLPDGTTVRFRSKGRNGRTRPGPFGKDSVRDILQRIFYTGQVSYRGHSRIRKNPHQPTQIFSGRHPPLISDELFQRCQEVRALMRHHPRRHPDYADRLYLLSGILRCAKCKRKMRAQAGHGTRYYQDTTRLQCLGDCDQPMVKADVMEQKVAHILMDLAVPDEWQEKALTYLRSPQEIERLRQEEQKIQEQLSRLRRLFIEGDINYEEHQQEKLRLQMKAAEELERFEALWRTGTMLERKRLLQAHLTAVLIQGETIEAVQPALVSYPLFQHQESQCRNYGSDGIKLSM